ncbi:MFS transporter [Enemella evansiae]|uniref:MFS transporter n=1 Tax=Enemella evansiae TaxID=2016499 RepID=A0A255GGX2_9ACTN|nr:MFS transporter [Enemella evansiae]OYO03800.1 MFS transporter [Enemella evansiae]OYO13573.1 MFS transporter [Enemella evansiae]
MGGVDVPSTVVPTARRASILARVGRGVALRQWVRRRTDLPRDVIVLGLIAFCVAVGFGVLIPVLPVFTKSFGVNNLQVGMVVSAFALVRLVTSPFCGRIAAVLGGRTTLAVGIWIVAVSSALSGLATSYPWLLVTRGLGGVGSAMFTVSAMTLLLDSVPPRLRGRAAGFFQSGFLLGGMTGPAIGGLISQISLAAPFFYYAVTLAIAGTVGLLMLRNTGEAPAASTTAAPVRPMREVLRDPRYQAACLANLGQGWNSMGTRTALTPVLVVEVLHRDTSWTGIAFAVAAVVQTLALGPVGRFVDTVGRRPALIAAGLIGAAGMLALPWVPNIWALIGVLAVYGLAAAALGTAPPAAVGDAAGARGGTPVAVFSMCSDIGAILGPIVAGAIADQVGMPAAFATGAVLLLAGAAVSLRMPPGVPAAEPVTESDVGERR